MIYPLSGMRKEAGIWDNAPSAAQPMSKQQSLKNFVLPGAGGAALGQAGAVINRPPQPQRGFWNSADDAATTINSVYGKPGKGVYWNNPTQGKRQLPDSFKRSLQAGLLGGATGLAGKYLKQR